jgi:hypothetical protein
MNAAQSSAVLILALGLTPATGLAGGGQSGAVTRAYALSGTLDGCGRELSYVDVSSDGDRGRGAIALRLPDNRGTAESRAPDPIPVFRWTTRGEWRRHRSVAPVGSVVVPLA